MKWGRKKLLSSTSYSSSSSSHSPSSSSLPHCSRPPSLISHVFPVSWLSKFKHKNTSKSKPKPTKPNPKETTKFNSPYGIGRGKFYYASEDDGDAFWRLSFGQDSGGEKSKRVGPKPQVWHGRETEEEPSSSSCSNCGRSEARKYRREKETVMISPRRAKSSRESKRSTCSYTLDHLREVEEEEEEEEDFSDDKVSFDLLSLREMEAEGEERKSLYVSMEKQMKRNGNRVKARSPRTPKVKALEDMKKANLKKRTKNKKKKERRVESKAGLDSYAVVKSSHDPEKDFKDSMAEMISEKKMSQPGELEELLACYLTLNSDENHGLIIKAFREVWLELAELKKQQVSSD